VKKLVIAWLIPVMVALLGGCETTQKQEEAGAEVGEAGMGEGAGATTGGLADRGGLPGTAALNDPNSPLYTKVIYFEFDRSDIGPEYVDTLRAHAEYLAANPQARVTLEGHCDERGTREYNLALGEQRAEQVRRFLLAEGVSGSQIDTLSYGEERAADPGHYESAWALNRRAVLVY
jgi:peptidoglycan-associated lipoprotein